MYNVPLALEISTNFIVLSDSLRKLTTARLLLFYDDVMFYLNVYIIQFGEYHHSSVYNILSL